jgi:hypothetical protein
LPQAHAIWNLAHMPQPIVVLAHAPQAQSAANQVSAALSSIGFAVAEGAGAPAGRAQAAKIEAAHRVVLVSSRAGRASPATRAAIQRARAKGKLVCVSADATHPAKKLPRTAAAWRTALAQRPLVKAPPPARLAKKPARVPSQLKPQVALARAAMEKPIMSTASDDKPHPLAQAFGLVVVTAFLTLMIGAALHQSDAHMAARIDAMTAQVQSLIAKR